MAAYAVHMVRWALVLILASAAIGKLVRDGGVPGLAATIRRGLRLPGAGYVAWALVVAELAVAGALSVPGTFGGGLLAAMLLMATLTVGAAVVAGRAEGLPCHCFGASSVVTWGVVGRNAMLTAGAGAAVMLNGRDGGPESGHPSVAGFVIAAVVVLTWWAAGVWSRRGRRASPPGLPDRLRGQPATLPPNGPTVGLPAPDLADEATGGLAEPAGTGPAGTRPAGTRPAGTGPAGTGPVGRPRLIAFLSVGCRGCHEAVPGLIAHARAVGGLDHVVAVIVGDHPVGADPHADGSGSGGGAARGFGDDAALADVARHIRGPRAERVAEAYRVVLFPTFVVLTSDGRVEAVSLSVDELPRPVR